MRVTFGPENDHRHTPDPAPSGAYEWWYFDALSEDGRWALVAIFFLGSPMSPYYKAVVDGRRPDSRDWCGVFFSLHERLGPGRWAERAYAYNLYPGAVFAPDGREYVVGASRVVRDGRADWRLCLDEPALWRGRCGADLRFTAAFVPSPVLCARDPGDSPAHAWICVAPRCRVEGIVTTVRGERIPFRGDGYHDHNAGILPFSNFDRWYWARAHLVCSDGATRTLVLYQWERRGAAQTDLYVFEPDGTPLVCRRGITPNPAARQEPEMSRETARFGLRHAAVLSAEAAVTPPAGAAEASADTLQVRAAADSARHARFVDGPFYRRMPYSFRVQRLRPRPDGDAAVVWDAEGAGIGEVFVPDRLCGPVASRALWTRLRRRGGAP